MWESVFKEKVVAGVLWHENGFFSLTQEGVFVINFCLFECNFSVGGREV